MEADAGQQVQPEQPASLGFGNPVLGQRSLLRETTRGRGLWCARHVTAGPREPPARAQCGPEEAAAALVVVAAVAAWTEASAGPPLAISAHASAHGTE